MKTLKHIPPTPFKGGFFTSLLALCLSMGISQNANADLKDGLVAHWSFDDCRATDNSGNGHDGTLGGNPQCVDGVKGKAFSFDGVKDFIQVNDESMAFATENLTFSVWVNPNNSQMNFAGILDKSHATGLVSGWVFQKARNESSAYYFSYYIPEEKRFPNPFGEEQKIVTTPMKWNYLSITKHGNTITTYLNGIKTQEVTYSSGNILQNASPLFIGAVNGQNRYFNGQIDDLRIYNRALTEAEVMKLYNGGGVETGITSITPKTTVVGSPTVFTVTGKNLTDGMRFAVDDCEGFEGVDTDSYLSDELPGGSAEQRQFFCLAYGQASSNKKGGFIQSSKGENLETFEVTALALPKIDIVAKVSGSSVSMTLTSTEKLKQLENYDPYLRLTLPDGTTLFNDGKVFKKEKTPISFKKDVKKLSLKYSLSKAPKGIYSVDLVLLSKEEELILSKSNTTFLYMPSTQNSVTISSSAALQIPAKVPSVLAGLMNKPVKELMKDYATCNKAKNCSDEIKKALILWQMTGNKIFEKPTFSGIVGAYGIFKDEGKVFSKVKGNLDIFDKVMDGYWDYKNAGTLKSLTDEQRTLLLGLNILNAIGGGYYGNVAGELSSLLENTFTLLNSQKNFVFENFVKNGNILNPDWRLLDVNLTISSDKCTWTSWCDDVSEVTLVPAFYFKAMLNAGDYVENAKYDDFWKMFVKVPVTEKNITEKGMVTVKTEGKNPWLGGATYKFSGNDKPFDFSENLRPGFYTVKVKYKDGRVYIRPLLIRESGTYSITTG